MRLPHQSLVPNAKFSKGDEHIIEIEVKKRLEKGVINKTTHCNGEFFSSFFTRPKKDGSKGYLKVGHRDDILLTAETPDQLSQVVADTVALLRALGFTIHDTKSVTTPSQIAKFLGSYLILGT